MKAGLLVACLLAFPAAARAQDQVIGLLSIPEVFGAGACDRFVPEEVPLYEAPGSEPPDGSVARIGAIRVDTYWTFPSVGGCEGLTVNVHMVGTGSVGELPTREFGYEAPAAVVLQQRGRWFKVRLGDDVAWLRASGRDEYFPLEKLLGDDHLTYLTDAFDGRLAASPGAAPAGDGEPLASGLNVRVGELRRVSGQLWVQIEVLSHSFCESPDEPRVTARGWTRAHGASGEPTVWFYSRGC